MVIAAPGSSHGKTTVATGLMGALRQEGLEVAGFKIGPDYIDPGYHAMATGRPGRNLDPHLCREDQIVPLFLHGMAAPRPADVAVVEGVMGLFDGQIGGDGYASTAHVAGLLRAPVVLVLDISSVSRTAAALVHGLHSFDPDVRLSGVILNKAGSVRHSDEVVRAMEATGLPVLGVLPRNAGIEAPSRHLGLVPAGERAEAAATITALAAQVHEHLDLSGLLALAHSAPLLTGEPWDPDQVVRPPSERRPVVAVAAGRAFTFRYAETDELLRAAGCEPLVFDPLTDAELPEGTAGIYLGGGFPEVHAGELAANASLRTALRTAIEAGTPTVAECAGLLYLCEEVDGSPMVGAIPARGSMTPTLTLGYRTVVADADSLLAEAGCRVTGHEFHRTHVEPAAGEYSAWLVEGHPVGFSADPAGLGRPTLHASYLHLHWAGHPGLAQRFAEAVHSYALRQAQGTAEQAQGTAALRQAQGSAEQAQGTAALRQAQGTAEPAQGTAALRQAQGTAEPAQGTAALRQAQGTVEPAQGTAALRQAQGTVEPARGTAEPAQGTAALRQAQGTAEPAQGTGEPAQGTGVDLLHHGDAEVGEGLVDFAVNVQHPAPPPWLADVITATVTELGAYPDSTEATAAVALAHGVEVEQVLLTAGAAEAFTLLARALRPERPVVVHPQFTEPEAALLAAGHAPVRVLLGAAAGFRLDPDRVPAEADLVVVGNPTNPTSVLHPVEALEQLRRPGRVLVVDEAFLDAVVGPPRSMIEGDLTGLLVLRSLTKTWGLAGLRAGYVVGDPALVARLRAQQPPWSVSTPALAAVTACVSPKALELAAEQAELIAARRTVLIDGLAALGLPVAGAPTGPFVLVDTTPARGDRPAGGVREALRGLGFAARRGDTFPGLGPDWVRIAVRDEDTTRALLDALTTVTGARP